MPKYGNDIQNKRFVSGKDMFSGIRNKQTVSSHLYRYRMRNMVVRVRKNVYLPVNPGDGNVDENKFEIGCSAVPESYSSYHSAMEYYDWQNQVFNRICLSAGSGLLNSTSWNTCTPRTSSGKVQSVRVLIRRSM